MAVTETSPTPRQDGGEVAVSGSVQTLTLLQHTRSSTGSTHTVHPPPATFSIALGISHMFSSHVHTEAEQEKTQNLSNQGEPTNTAEN